MKDRFGRYGMLPIFVYGTLRPGMVNHARFLAGAIDCILPATVPGQLYLVEAGNYPYLVPGRGTVFGEVIHLTADRYAETMQRIDRLEEYDPSEPGNSVYIRRKAEATLTNGEKREAWTYFWNLEETVGRCLASGDFRKETAGLLL